MHMGKLALTTNCLKWFQWIHVVSVLFLFILTNFGAHGNSLLNYAVLHMCMQIQSTLAILIECLGFRFQMDSCSFTGLFPFSLTNLNLFSW